MRAQAVAAVLAMLRGADALDGVGVYSLWPGDRNQSPEMIWVGVDLDGDLEVPVMTAGPKTYDDQFELPLEIQVAGSWDPDRAAARAGEIADSIIEVLRTDHTVGGLDSVITATVSRYRGPTGVVTPERTMAWAQITVSLHLRIN